MSNNWFGALPFDWPILINTAELHFYFNAQDKWPNMVLFGLLSRDGNLGYLCFFFQFPADVCGEWGKGGAPRGKTDSQLHLVLLTVVSLEDAANQTRIPSILFNFGTVRPVYLCGDTRRDSLKLKSKIMPCSILERFKMSKACSSPNFFLSYLYSICYFREQKLHIFV